MARVGVDVGGTFTDLILETDGAAGNGDGRVFVYKVPSTPEDQSRGVIQGVLEICAEAGVAPGAIEQIVHGTTIATNTVIEYSGAEVGMLTTRGFRDILHMARHKRPHNFSVQFDVPWQSRPLVKRRNRVPITERILPPDGSVATALDEDEVRAAAELFKAREVDAIIVCFLFAFLNDAHEKRAKEIVREVMPDAYVSCSSEVVDVIREYERFSTAAMNAFIGPRTSFYLNNLDKALKENGVDAQNSRHAVQRRRDDACRRRRTPGDDPDVRAGRRRHRRPVGGRHVGRAQPDHGRYRRHVGGHQRGAGRRGPHHEPAGYAGGRLPDPGTDDRPFHHWRRRRVDRLCR